MIEQRRRYVGLEVELSVLSGLDSGERNLVANLGEERRALGFGWGALGSASLPPYVILVCIFTAARWVSPG